MKTLPAQDTKLVSGGDGAVADCSAAAGGAIVIVVTDGAAALAGVAIGTAGAALACAQDLSTGSGTTDSSPSTSYDGVDCSQLDYMGGA